MTPFGRRACLGALAMIVGTACTRDPESGVCPPAQVGDLVISEIRGNQKLEDINPDGEWIEIYNRTADDIELVGLRIELHPVDGTPPVKPLVREPELMIPAHGYFVLGHTPHNMRSANVDYGYMPPDTNGDGELPDDLKRDFPNSVDVQVYACDTLIDRTVQHNLADLGTRSFDGDLEPDADINDQASAVWCEDQAPPEAGDINPADAPGTPGAANRPCPDGAQDTGTGDATDTGNTSGSATE